MTVPMMRLNTRSEIGFAAHLAREMHCETLEGHRLEGAIRMSHTNYEKHICYLARNPTMLCLCFEPK